MLNSIRPRLRASTCDERGIAMIVVIGLGAALTVLVTALVVLAVNNLRQAGLQGRGEQALHAADASLDWVLEELRTSDGTTPEDPALDPDPDTPEVEPFTDEQQEHEAVLAAAEDLIASSPARLVTSPMGQWLALRPEDTDGTDLTGIAYGVGYIPSRVNPDRIRILRAEYEVSILTSEGPAMLSNGDIRLSSGATIDGSVHANGNFYASSEWDATGPVTSSGPTCENCTTYGAPGSGPSKPAVVIDPVRPRDFYDLGISGSERWDLCPDGSVRLPASEDAPCTGTVVFSGSGSYRGWKFEGGSSPVGKTWKYEGNVDYHGIYYVYQGNALVGSSVGAPGAPWRVTIIAETESDPDDEASEPPADHCPHVGGDIILSSSARVKPHAAGQNILFYAGRDVLTSSSVFFEGPPSNHTYAHEQIRISSAIVMDGGFVSENACNSPGSYVDSTTGIELSSSADITYDGSGGAALENSVKTTIWSEI